MERSRDDSLGTHGGPTSKAPSPPAVSTSSAYSKLFTTCGAPTVLARGVGFILLPSPSSPCLPPCAGSPARNI